jgi:hypothetical protein
VTVNGLPTLTAPATATVNIGKATAIPGLGLAETGNTASETFTVKLADTDGLLSATGTGVSGAGTKSLTLTGLLAQVNADLATLTDTEATGTLDTLTLNATDGLGNQAAAATVSIQPAGQTFILTAAPTTITGTVGNDTIISTNATLNSRDHIDGGGGSGNLLMLSGGGSFDLGAPAQLVGIQLVAAAEGQAPSSGGGVGGVQTIYLRDGLDLTVNVASGTQAVGNTNVETISIYGSSANNVINLGTGNDIVVLGGVGETVNGGGGSALVQAAANLAGALVNGGTGKTTLEITSGGSAVLNAASNHLTVQLDAATHLTLSNMAFITAAGSAGADTITAMASGQTSTGGAGADTLIGFSGFGDTFVDTSSGLNGDTIQMFGGNDVIDLTDLNFAGTLPLAYTGTATAGTLTASDGSHKASIKFVGNYTVANFQLASDSHQGSVISFIGH